LKGEIDVQRAESVIECRSISGSASVSLSHGARGYRPSLVETMMADQLNRLKSELPD
jgi:hypothetical protein